MKSGLDTSKRRAEAPEALAELRPASKAGFRVSGFRRQSLLDVQHFHNLTVAFTALNPEPRFCLAALLQEPLLIRNRYRHGLATEEFSCYPGCRV